MMRFTLFLVSCIIQAAAAASSQSSSNENDDDASPAVCKLWLAKSHLYEPDAPKYGLFAGVSYEFNETLPNFEIAVPLVDFTQGPHQSNYPDAMQSLETYFWTADYAGAAKWEGNESTNIFVPGIGTLANYHSVYSNVDWWQPAVLHREYPEFWTNAKDASSQPHQSRSTVSSYFNLTMRALTHIPVGMELFANFGEVWDPQVVDVYEQQLAKNDYTTADAILKNMHEYLMKYEKELSGELGMEVVDFMRESVLGPHHGRRYKSIRSLLPATPNKIQNAFEIGGTFLYRNQDMIKDLDWLSTKGVCVDTLEVKPSTIPEAGFGAFATRDFDYGETISVSPMIVMDKELLSMYSVKEVEGGTGTDKDEDGGSGRSFEYDTNVKIGEQLALNYAFGHYESSVVFLPTAPHVAYMNHDSQDFNAYVDWSEHDFVRSKDELTAGSLDDLKQSPQLSAVFQIVAVRDIEKGEEILINYGQKWEDAWTKHWQTQRQNEWTKKAMDVVNDYIDKPYAVDLKVGTVPYPKGVVTACYIMWNDVEDGRPKTNHEGQQILQWTGPRIDAEMSGTDLVVCDLIDRDMDEAGSYVYTVKARVKGATEIAQVEGVAHSAVTLVDRPYTSDMHAPGAFRHWIELEDHRFPQQWRDLRT